MGKMTFQENLLRKMELERLASRVIASFGSEQVRHPVDKEAMRSLLELSPYRYQQERDLDLYVNPGEGGLKMILVLDNELPIFRSTVKDVVTRRSPRTLEMWKISTIRHILVDSDIKISTRKDSVATVLKDAVAKLDLTYTDKDIEDLAREGMAWLAGKKPKELEKHWHCLQNCWGIANRRIISGWMKQYVMGLQPLERVRTRSSGPWSCTVLLPTPWPGLTNRFPDPTVCRWNTSGWPQPAKHPFLCQEMRSFKCCRQMYWSNPGVLSPFEGSIKYI